MIYIADIINENAVIRHCYGYGPEVEVPANIAGYTVTELAPYAFSDQVNKRRDTPSGMTAKSLIWDEDKGALLSQRMPPEDIPPMHGSSITLISLPRSLRKIGAYAFYNCRSLRGLSFHEGLKDLGAGLFSGCRSLKELRVCLGSEQTSCLKEMLQELHGELTVYMEGSVRAKLCFPAYYEEIVENTPARVFSTEMHGSGRNYRDSFSQRKFDFVSYDSCFNKAASAEEFSTIWEITLARLIYPEELTPGRRKNYEDWLYDNYGRALEKAVSERDTDAIVFIARNKRTSAAQLKFAADKAAGKGFAEAAAIIMDALKAKEPESRTKLTASRRFRL